MVGAVRERTNFTHSDPGWRVPLQLPQTFVSIDDVAAGDIVYTRRPRGYQRLAAIAGDTWRHIGLSVTIAGFPWLIEMGPGGFQARPMTTVFIAYDTVAVQRLRSCNFGCRTAFVNRVCARMQHPACFHNKLELAGIGASSLLRLRKRDVRGADRLRQWFSNRDGFEERAICSTPIVDSLDSLCAQHQVVLDVTSYKHHSPSVANSTLAGLAMPDDIWRALQSTSSSYWIRKDEHAPVVQRLPEATSREEVTQMQLGT